MELDITHMVEASPDMRQLSGSVMELGNNAGRITWNNSKSFAKEKPLLRPDQIQEAKDYFKDFGAWDDEERAAWTDEEVQALVIQLVAGDIREMEAYDDTEEYMEAQHRGSVSGNIYCNANGTKWFYTLSH